MDFYVDVRADFSHGLRSRAGATGRVKAEHFKDLPPFPLGALGVPTSDMGAVRFLPVLPSTCCDWHFLFSDKWWWGLWWLYFAFPCQLRVLRVSALVSICGLYVLWEDVCLGLLLFF